MAKALPDETVKVRFKNFEGWLLSDDGYGRALAPYEHCDENGNVVEFFNISYAHFYPKRDVVMRFREEIGSSDDFEVL